LDLPDPEEVLAGRMKMPQRGDLVAAAAFALVMVALEEREDRMDRVAGAWRVLGQQRPDTVLVPARALLDGSGGEVSDEAAELGSRLLGLKQ